MNAKIQDAKAKGPTKLATGSVAAALLGIAVLIIPFIGVFAAAVLDPLAIGLGWRAAELAEGTGRYRRTALAGISLGSFALGLLAMFLITGAYSEYAR